MIYIKVINFLKLSVLQFFFLLFYIILNKLSISSKTHALHNKMAKFGKDHKGMVKMNNDTFIFPSEILKSSTLTS